MRISILGLEESGRWKLTKELKQVKEHWESKWEKNDL